MDLIIVDCQYDFIDGTLACANAHNAVSEIIDYVNNCDVRALYSLDWHSPENRSFSIHGGIWPIHCVAGEHGSKLSKKFYSDICDEAHKPCDANMYFKGTDDEVEEYSAAYARDKNGAALIDVVGDEVLVAGIASEYCVRETVLELMSAGKKVSVLKNAVAYVDEAAHEKNLAELEAMGVSLI